MVCVLCYHPDFDLLASVIDDDDEDNDEDGDDDDDHLFLLVQAVCLAVLLAIAQFSPGVRACRAVACSIVGNSSSLSIATKAITQ